MALDLNKLANLPGYGKASYEVRENARRDVARKGFSNRKVSTHLRTNYREAWCDAYNRHEEEWFEEGFESNKYSQMEA